jgi:hypothetical protein
VHYFAVLLQGLGREVGLLALVAAMGARPGVQRHMIGQVAPVVEGLAATAAAVL